MSNYIVFTKNQKVRLCGRGDLTSLSFQKSRNRQKSGETCEVTWEIKRLLRVDRRTAKIMH